MKALVAVLFLSVGLNTHALTKRHSVNFYGAEFHGFEQIGLKRLLRDDLDRRELAMWDIDSLSIDIKSFDDKGQLKVVSGAREIFSSSVVGTADNFASSTSGFTTKFTSIPSYAKRDGALKLILLGDLKLSKVDTVLKATPSYDFRNVSQLSFSEEKKFKVNKIIGSSETVRPNGPVDGIRLVGLKEKVNVTSVKIVFFDGETIEIDELEGRLSSNESRSFRLAHELDKPVDKIIVSAVSSKLIGGRGELRVDLAH